MPEAMAVHALCDACLTGQTWEQVAHVILAHLASIKCADQRLAIRDVKLSPPVDPRQNDRSAAGIDADDSVAVALPMLDSDRSLIEIKILGSQCEHLRDA